MSDHQAFYPIAAMCRLLGVSSSGYYAWAKRPRSQRAKTDDVLLAEIPLAHEISRGTYGAPLVHAELASKGIHVGRKRIARLMNRSIVSDKREVLPCPALPRGYLRMQELQIAAAGPHSPSPRRESRFRRARYSGVRSPLVSL